jgi:hypothetical protein
MDVDVRLRQDRRGVAAAVSPGMLIDAALLGRERVRFAVGRNRAREGADVDRASPGQADQGIAAVAGERTLFDARFVGRISAGAVTGRMRAGDGVDVDRAVVEDRGCRIAADRGRAGAVSGRLLMDRTRAFGAADPRMRVCREAVRNRGRNDVDGSSIL